MSIRVMALVWDRYPKGGSKLLALLALADWADDDGGRVYPSMAALAAKIRMSDRQAVRLVHDLVKTDFIELLTPNNTGGRRTTNRYLIRLDTLSNCQSLRRPQPLEARSETLTKSTETLTPRVLNSDTAMSPNPLEPLKEPAQERTEKTPGANRSYGADWAAPEPRRQNIERYIRHLINLPTSAVTQDAIKKARGELRSL